MSKENSILALKLLTQEELVHYAYYVGEALAGASKSIEEWVETWKQQKKEIEKLRADRQKLVEALRFYAFYFPWSKPEGARCARTTLKELGEME